jgi:hypothetical protein
MSKMESQLDIGHGIRTLCDGEMEAVHGGTINTGFRLLAQVLSELEEKEAQKVGK